MNFHTARKLDIGAQVYPKANPDKTLTVVSKKVILKQPSIAQWWNIVSFTCNDGNQYMHSDLTVPND